MRTLTRQPLWRVHPSAFLLAAQLLLLVLYAIFEGLHSQRALIHASGVVVLVLRVWVINRSPGFDWVAWVLAVPAFALNILSALFVNSVPLLVWASALEATLYFYAAASLIAYMMADVQVTTDELFAAGATFTLIAWGFAHLYLVMETLAPGSLISTVAPNRVGLTFVELLFLSFTNLTAAGLSDILPVSTTARVLMMLEQFTGIGYVAVVISRLVGLTIQRHEEKR